MNRRLLTRLDRLAAAREALLLETVRRHNAQIAQAETQTGVLTAYRDRLGASWQGGAVVPAAQARRAGQFAAAALGAQAQIGQAALLATGQLEAALTQLAQLKSHRRALSAKDRVLTTQSLREAELAAARELPCRAQPVTRNT